MNEMVFWAFCDELEKIAAKIPVMHGTSGRWAVLRPRVGAAIGKRDPNEAALFLATKRRSSVSGVAGFAHEAVKARGGEPVIGLAKVDTKKGWTARTLTDWGKKNLGSLEDARDLVAELDENPTRERRKEIWQAVQKGVGSWTNPSNPAATAKPFRYRPA